MMVADLFDGGWLRTTGRYGRFLLVVHSGRADYFDV